MLVKLPHGVCVDPENVKYLHIRTDRPKGVNAQLVHTVVMKTDEDQFISIAATDNREEAVQLAYTCAALINKGLGEDEDVDDSFAKPAKSASSGGSDDVADDDGDSGGSGGSDDDDWDDDDDW